MTSFVRLRHVLFLAITVVAVVPAILLAISVKGPALDRELAAVEERHLQIARHMTSALDRYAVDLKAVFSYAVGQLRRDTADDGLARLLSKFHFNHVCLVNDRGEILKRVLSRDAGAGAVMDRVDLPSLLASRTGDDESMVSGTTFTGVMAGIDGVPRIFLVGPEANGIRGIAALRTDYFVALQQAIAFGDKGHAAIVDQFGRVVAHPKKDWRQQIRDISDVYPVSRMKVGETGVATFHSPAVDKMMIAGFATVSDVGWGVMVPQPLDELERTAEGLREITAGIVLLSMIAAAALSWYLAGRLTRPLLAVTQAAAGMARGHAGSPLAIRRWLPVELVSLTQSFNSMLQKITATERELRQSNARIGDFANTAADWFWEMNDKLEFIYLSERFEEVCGLPPEALIGLTPRQIVAREAPEPEIWQQHLRVLDAHQPFRDVQFPWRRPDGEIRAISSGGRPIFDSDGVFLGYRGAARDVSEEYRLAKELRHQAQHDALTGLVNRREFESRLLRAWSSARGRNVESVLCYMDLDQFKIVNDAVGHVAGDALLTQIADVLKSRVRDRDTLARLGGDEFSLLLDNCPIDKAEEVARSVIRSLRDYRFSWNGRDFSIGVSIGLVAINSASESATELMSQADHACYAAKDLGGNRVYVYRLADEEFARRRRGVL